jgi:hypothetical protein
MADRFTGKNLPSIGIPDIHRKGPKDEHNTLMGVYLAKVVDNVDIDYQGSITVELIGHQTIGERNTAQDRSKYHKIRSLSKFGGSIQRPDFTLAYGESSPPPSRGTEVLVAFTGSEQEGYLLGVLGDSNRNSMLPGIPASETDNGVEPTFDVTPFEEQKGNKRPRHPIVLPIAEQGLGLDPVRGIGSSGARRESPSRVAGMLTPNGHSLVMDDGTKEFEEGECVTPDKNRAGGDNNLIRIRSAGGGQFLINDTAGIVYVINQNGTSWVQLDENGNMDVYAKGSVSYHAEEDFNFYAGGDINMDADSFNIKARGAAGIQAETVDGPMQFKSNKDIRLTTDLNMHLKSEGFSRTTAKLIDLNGPKAFGAVGPTSGSLTSNTSIKESVNPRVPEHEPWGGHLENTNAVASQAPSKINRTAKDIDISNIQSSSGKVGPQ